MHQQLAIAVYSPTVVGRDGIYSLARGGTTWYRLFRVALTSLLPRGIFEHLLHIHVAHCRKPWTIVIARTNNLMLSS